MEVSNEAIRENFQSKVDTELLELAASSGGMTPDSKFLLLQELQSRLAKTKAAGNTVQLIHGWYTVTAPIYGVKFPECCPRCSRSGTDTTLRFKSLEHRRFRLFYWKAEGAVLAVPHCSECAANLKRTRAICSWAAPTFRQNFCFYTSPAGLGGILAGVSLGMGSISWGGTLTTLGLSGVEVGSFAVGAATVGPYLAVGAAVLLVARGASC